MSTWWTDDLGSWEIPSGLKVRFRRDGWPDKRCKVMNREFWAWVERMRREAGHP